MSRGSAKGDAVRRELIALYENSDTDWMLLLDNDVYEVLGATSQEEAKHFVTENLWNVLFPEKTGAPPNPSE